MSNNPLYNLTNQKISFSYQNLLQTDGYGNYYNGLGDEISIGGKGPTGPTGPGFPPSALLTTFGITIDVSESYSDEINPGDSKDVIIPYDMDITGWTILSDEPGNIEIDLWKTDYENFPPTPLNSITGTEKPKLINDLKNRNNSLSTWSTSISSGDIIRFNVDSVEGINKFSIYVQGIIV